MPPACDEELLKHGEFFARGDDGNAAHSGTGVALARRDESRRTNVEWPVVTNVSTRSLYAALRDLEAGTRDDEEVGSYG
jgi:hypothetical protein